jgi:quinol monooxygenase YgiN
VLEPRLHCSTGVARDKEGCFYLHEFWESQAALDDHVETPHFQHLQQKIGKLMAEPFEVNILEEVPLSAAAV